MWPFGYIAPGLRAAAAVLPASDRKRGPARLVLIALAALTLGGSLTAAAQGTAHAAAKHTIPKTVKDECLGKAIFHRNISADGRLLDLEASRVLQKDPLGKNP